MVTVCEIIVPVYSSGGHKLQMSGVLYDNNWQHLVANTLGATKRHTSECGVRLHQNGRNNCTVKDRIAAVIFNVTNSCLFSRPHSVIGRCLLCDDVNGTGLPAVCRKALEALSAELNGVDPSFTVCRHMQHALDNHFLVDELRKVCCNTSSLLITLIFDNNSNNLFQVSPSPQNFSGSRFKRHITIPLDFYLLF